MELGAPGLAFETRDSTDLALPGPRHTPTHRQLITQRGAPTWARTLRPGWEPLPSPSPLPDSNPALTSPSLKSYPKPIRQPPPLPAVPLPKKQKPLALSAKGLNSSNQK